MPGASIGNNHCREKIIKFEARTTGQKCASNSLDHYTQSMKERDDEKEGWAYEEVKPVQVRFGNYTSAIMKAEVHREPQMGFRRPERTTVKVGIPLVNFGQAGFQGAAR
jgi:hypothetical protein